MGPFCSGSGEGIQTSWLRHANPIVFIQLGIIIPTHLLYDDRLCDYSGNVCRLLVGSSREGGRLWLVPRLRGRISITRIWWRICNNQALTLIESVYAKVATSILKPAHSSALIFIISIHFTITYFAKVVSLRWTCSVSTVVLAYTKLALLLFTQYVGVLVCIHVVSSYPLCRPSD